jgi:hypothetical protein
MAAAGSTPRGSRITRQAYTRTARHTRRQQDTVAGSGLPTVSPIIKHDQERVEQPGRQQSAGGTPILTGEHDPGREQPGREQRPWSHSIPHPTPAT